MAKIIVCKTCGKEIAKSAKACPHCGAKKKSGCLRSVLAAFLLVFGIAAILGALGGGEAPSSSTGENTPGNSVVYTQPAETIIEVSPATLRAEYQENEVAADAKYDNNLLKITGTINNIGKDILDDVYLTIETGEYLYDIQCYFSDASQIDIVATLKDGDTITLIGRCSGLSLTNVIVKDCEIQ